MLGNAVSNAYTAAGHDVTALAHSRATGHLKKLDLTNFADVDSFFEAARPDCEPSISESSALTTSPKGSSIVLRNVDQVSLCRASAFRARLLIAGFLAFRRCCREGL